MNAVYNPAGQLTSEKKTRPGLLGVPSVSTTTYTYDDNGNRTREQTGAAVTDYTYTADDRLAGIDQGLREVAYEYDGLGRGLVEEVSSLLVLQNRTEQLWDGMVVVAQDSTAGGSTSLVRDVAGDVALQASDGLLGTDTRWGLTDRLGSTIGQAQGSKISQLAEYSDWGVPVFGTLGWDSETGYTGELGDTTAEAWNFYARSYDPMAATWLHADSYRGDLGNPQTLGRYGYVGNNPVTATDAFGFLSNRMQTETRQGKTRAQLTRELERQDQVRILNRVNANRAALGQTPVETLATSNGKFGGPKPKPRTPTDASNPTERHGDNATLLAVLDTVGTIAGFAAFLPGPQQPVFAAIAGIAGAAAAFMRCATGGINADCIINVIFAALGPIGRGLKTVIGPIVKQALGGTRTVSTTTRATPGAASATSGGSRPVQALPRGGATLSQDRLEHIVYRHWPSSGFSGVGKFAEGTSLRNLRSMIDDVARNGSIRPNTGGRPGTIFERDLGQVIGLNGAGKPTSRVRVVVAPDGTVITAFPF